MWISLSMRQRSLTSTLRHLRRLSDVLPHPQHAVDLATFLHQQPFGVDVAMHDAGRLQLDAFLRVDRAAHFATDDRLATDDVALDFPASRHEDLLGGPHGPADRSFDLHDAVGRDVADDA